MTNKEASSEDSPGSQTSAVRTFLESYRGKNLYHPPLVDDRAQLVGNNGDRLMILGTDIVYRDLEVNLVDSPEEADLIVIGASGGMHERFRWIRGLFRRMSQQYPDTPLCVLPSTFYFPTRPFSQEIGERSAPLTLFCREEYSARHLEQMHDLPGCCEVVLDHDLAFELRASELVHRLGQVKQRHILMVERVDVEHNAIAMRPGAMRWRKRIGQMLPQPVKKALYPAVRRYRAVRPSAFRDQCEALIRAHYADLLSMRRYVADISNVNTVGFEGFCEAIAGASVVFTTRLHVGILAAMLDKPTCVFEGPYHKIRGVYEHSLQQHSTVRLVERDTASA